ncbi:MAG: hypothetical protein DMF74_11015 [Acidobacteria bacterium]|nr:MAG: hypothetical protein DMF74_11015 [Acidobacteriota bacterium]
MPSFAAKTRVEVYLPIRYEPAYQDTLSWLIDEFTELRGGCTVHENIGGYYLSQSNEVIDDRVSLIYSDFPMNWDREADRSDVLKYCARLQSFLLTNLWEEEILIGAYPVVHVQQ